MKLLKVCIPNMLKSRKQIFYLIKALKFGQGVNKVSFNLKPFCVNSKFDLSVFIDLCVASCRVCFVVYLFHETQLLFLLFFFTPQNLITVDIITIITWMFDSHWQPQDDRQQKRDNGSQLKNRPFFLQKSNNLNI